MVFIIFQFITLFIQNDLLQYQIFACNIQNLIIFPLHLLQFRSDFHLLKDHHLIEFFYFALIQQRPLQIDQQNLLVVYHLISLLKDLIFYFNLSQQQQYQLENNFLISSYSLQYWYYQVQSFLYLLMLILFLSFLNRLNLSKKLILDRIRCKIAN